MIAEAEDKRRNEDLTAWRKNQVFTLWSKGWTQTRIARELNCINQLLAKTLPGL